MSDLARQLIAENQRTRAPFLDLGNCGLTDANLPDELFNLYWLIKLNLGVDYWIKPLSTQNFGLGNRLTGKSLYLLSQFPRLQTLDLSSNQIEDYSFLVRLIQLQNLILTSNRIENIGFLQNLTHLQTLNLSYNQIKNIEYLERLTQLQTLNLVYNQIEDTGSLGKLTQLRILNLSSNRTENTQFLEKLTQLQTLDLSYNQIKDIHFSEKLTQLQTLDLSYNKIKDIHIPDTLTQLQSLNVNNNQIKDIHIPDTLTQLQTLDLSYNKIRDIHFSEKLTQLQTLDLSYNQIKDIHIPDTLTQLQSLNVNNNQIKDIHIPDTLTQLQTLDLSYNKIRDIDSLQKLTQLQSLNLINNDIIEFSEQLLQGWPLLRTLYLRDNPIENIPKEVFQQNDNILKNLWGYFISIKQGSIQNDEVKLIVVGNTTAGKTSLMQFIWKGNYKNTQNSTHGIKLTRWPVPDINLNVNVWDFGGQEYYHATHRLFLDDHAIYVVVWETNTNHEGNIPTDIYLNDKKYQLSLDHFPYSYWLDSIRYYAPNSTILLVQNKIDKTSIQNVSDEYFKSPYNVHTPTYHLSVNQANEYKNKLSHPAWTAFQDFKANLITALQTDAARYKLGIGWVAIRDAIRQIAETQRWTTFAEFAIFCHQAATKIGLKFDISIEMPALLAYLSGAASTIVYYGGDVQLRNIVILNPQWVTDTIYDILTYDIREKADRPGEFNRGQVNQILSEKRIGELTDTFLELMKKDRFELIFEKPNCQDEYIAPQYLPDKHDERDLRRYRSKTKHSFTLHFPGFMPRSVFLRFMVRYGNLATEVYWKNGIVLEKAGIDILAECVFPERKIRVAIESNSQNSFSRELFDGLWRLSDRKSDINLSVNETDFVEIGYLIDALNQVPKIKSKQGNWLDVKDFFHLFGKSLPPTNILSSNKMLNKNTPEIFFSYAWGDEHETGESREKIVDELYKSLKNEGHLVFRDKMDLSYKGLISDFMRQIGKGDIVIVAISDKYLKSPYCMFELLEIYRISKFTKEQFVKVVFPIRVENIALDKPGIQGSYFDYWNEREKEWKELITKHSDRIKPAQFNEYDKVRSIHNQLGDLLDHLRDMNALTKDLLSADNFAKIKEAIKDRFESLKS
ncbi:leucine-rich repeat domain-containing protein [Runella sp.]|uniref:leucine-rich repeat domain-containing protein n=1 Tax=Runella sp. TaxID=1960881 RepID=UPI003D0CB14D